MFNPKNQKRYILDGLFSGMFNFGASAITNHVNHNIARENLGFQREELDYKKQLQQEIFEREDTAYQRAVEDAQKVGLNPMAIASNGGSSAGNVVPTEALHNDFQAQSPVFEGIGDIAPIAQVAQTYNELQTGNTQRDLLQQQTDQQRLENLVYAHKNGFIQNSNGDWEFIGDDKAPMTEREKENIDYADKKATAERNERENQRQKDFNYTDSSTNYEKLLTGLESQLQNPQQHISLGKSFASFASSIVNPIPTFAKAMAFLTSKANRNLDNSIQKEEIKKGKSKKKLTPLSPHSR